MNIKMKYQWKRFWTPFGTSISLADGGFLYDPGDAVGKFINPDLKTLKDLQHAKCLILLGEPGIGKSAEIKGLYESTAREQDDYNSLWINLGDMPTFDYFMKELEEDSKYQQWEKDGKPLYLFLDSFDEGVFEFKSFANFFTRFLTKKQDKLGTLYLRVSCRTAVWPSYFEKSLMALFGEKQITKYELCPMTKADVMTALDTRGIGKEKFLQEVNERGVASLAGKPLTLEFLMGIFEKNGSLPTKKEDLYTEGCNLLVQEHDDSKKKSSAMKPKLSLTQRIAIAERIAAATILAGKLAIVLDGNAGEGEVHISEIYGEEIIKSSSLIVEEDQINEVLNTGLFSARGDGKIGWAHQTYGEFLAAQYLTRHDLDWKRIRDLLFNDPLSIRAFQVVPQLYEVGAWLASINSSFFNKAVVTDPEFLLLCDGNVMTNSQKQALTEQLLTRLANGELFDRWETFNLVNYRKLCHPEIAKQLQPYIEDSSKGIVVRRSAIDIATACSTSSLEDFFIKITLSDKENLAIRVRTARAIAEMGSDKAREALRVLLGSNFDDDPEDELKGMTLEALWPKHIAAKELTKFITSPKKSSLFGAYHGFIERYVAANIEAKDVLVFLDWVEEKAIDTRKVDYSLRKLADAVVIRAWNNLSIPGVKEKLAKIIYTRLKNYDEVIGEHVMNDDIVLSFQNSLEAHDNERRNLVKGIVAALMHDEERKSGRNDHILLPHGNIHFILKKDLPWLIQWLNEETDEQIQELVAQVISRVFDIRSVHDIGVVIQARNKNSFLKHYTSYWFESVKLDSDDAREQRKHWQQEQHWQKKRERHENDEILKVISPPKIKQLLEKAEAGDTNSWWQIHNNMCMYQQELDEDDIQKLPGWKVLDEETQKRIIKCGKSFLFQQESKPEMWLGIGKIYFPALAGYRALKYFYKYEKEFIEKLDKEIWKKWAPIIVGMPLASNDPENGKLIALAYQNAPDEVIQTVDVLIDEEEQKHGSLFIIRLLDDCVDDKMSKFLLNKLKKNGFNINAAEDIMHFLLKHKIQAAKDYVKSLIIIPLPTDEEKRKQSLTAAVAFLWNAVGDDWNYLWDLIQKDGEFGHLLIEQAHDTPLKGSGVLQYLTEYGLAELYLWLMKEFPPERFYRPEGGHTVTPQVSISEWRDSTLQSLMTRGTAESYKEVKRIADVLPQSKWIKEYTLIETKRIALEKSWKPPTVERILEIVKTQEDMPTEKGEEHSPLEHNDNEILIDKGWKLIKKDSHAYIYDGETMKFTFEKTWTIQYKIFEYICKEKRFVSYNEIDEKINKKKKSDVGNDHKNMQRQMQLLRKKFQQGGLKEITIEISGGFLLKFADAK